MIDPAALRILLRVLTGWLDRREREAVAYLIERTGSCAVSLADAGYASRMTIVVGSPPKRTESVVPSCARSPRL